MSESHVDGDIPTVRSRFFASRLTKSQRLLQFDFNIIFVNITITYGHHAQDTASLAWYRRPYLWKPRAVCRIPLSPLITAHRYAPPLSVNK